MSSSNMNILIGLGIGAAFYYLYQQNKTMYVKNNVESLEDIIGPRQGPVVGPEEVPITTQEPIVNNSSDQTYQSPNPLYG